MRAVKRDLLRNSLVHRAFEDIVAKASLQSEHEPRDRQEDEGVIPDG
jgi:hypothetical protein